jgi:hypothetical protein
MTTTETTLKPKDSSMKNAHRAVIHVARMMPAVTARYANHGNSAVRKAAEHMSYIAGMADQENARQYESANDALYYMPFPQIEECLALAGY